MLFQGVVPAVAVTTAGCKTDVISTVNVRYVLSDVVSTDSPGKSMGSPSGIADQTGRSPTSFKALSTASISRKSFTRLTFHQGMPNLAVRFVKTNLRASSRLASYPRLSFSRCLNSSMMFLGIKLLFASI